MRILYLLQEFPYPPDHGLRTSSFYMLKQVSKIHQCDVLCFGEKSEKYRKAFNKACPGVNILGKYDLLGGHKLRLLQLWNILRGSIPSAARYFNKKFETDLLSALKGGKYDLVHVDWLNLAPYVQHVKNIPSILYAADAVSKTYLLRAKLSDSYVKKKYFYFLSNRTKKHEMKWFKRFDKVVVCAKEDLDFLKKELVLDDAEIIGIPVDSAFGVGKYRNGNKILFSSGNVDLEDIWHNLLGFVQDSWDLIGKKCNNLQFVIVARGIDEERRKLFCKKNIHVYDWVEDYVGLVKKSDIGVFFDRGGMGMKNRVAQTMFAGKPVVGFSKAFGGLNVVDRRHCYIAEDMGDLAQGVITLANDSRLRQSMGINAKKLILKDYAEQVVGKKWLKLYKEVKVSKKNA